VALLAWVFAWTYSSRVEEMGRAKSIGANGWNPKYHIIISFGLWIIINSSVGASTLMNNHFSSMNKASS